MHGVVQPAEGSEESIEFDNRKLGDSAEAQLAAIQKEVLLLDDVDFGISNILRVFFIKNK